MIMPIAWPLEFTIIPMVDLETEDVFQIVTAIEITALILNMILVKIYTLNVIETAAAKS
jgi:hypothetical protein